MTNRVRMIAVPYDSGNRGVRMGAGPVKFLDNGAAGVAGSAGKEAAVTIIESTSDFPAEIATSFELHRSVSRAVSAAVAAGELPIILSGNCGSAIGTISGLNAAASASDASTDIGIIWFDAHGDLNTPQTTASGFLDGMSLATITGRCWAALASSVPGFRPVPDRHVILAGARDFDNAESRLLDESEILVVSGDDRDGGASLRVALDELRTRVSRVYVHIDLDVHDAAEARANSFAQPGGYGTEAMLKAVAEIGTRFTIAAAGLTAYDPHADPDGAMLSAGLGLVQALSGRATERF